MLVHTKQESIIVHDFVQVRVESRGGQSFTAQGYLIHIVSNGCDRVCATIVSCGLLNRPSLVIGVRIEGVRYHHSCDGKWTQFFRNNAFILAIWIVTSVYSHVSFRFVSVQGCRAIIGTNGKIGTFTRRLNGRGVRADPWIVGKSVAVEHIDRIFPICFGQRLLFCNFFCKKVGAPHCLDRRWLMVVVLVESGAQVGLRTTEVS